MKSLKIEANDTILNRVESEQSVEDCLQEVRSN